jgi:hypothetical protein
VTALDTLGVSVLLRWASVVPDKNGLAFPAEAADGSVAAEGAGAGAGVEGAGVGAAAG